MKPYTLVLALPLAFSVAHAAETRTTEQRARLDSLAYEIFEPKVSGLEYRYERIKSKDLFARFGKPVIKSSKRVQHRDPAPDAPAEFEVIVWEFPGMVLEVGAYPPSATQQPELVWLRHVEISSSKHRLQHGLRIGQPLSSFASILGQPRSSAKQEVHYLVNEEIADDPYHYRTIFYRIRLSLDADRNVNKIVWDW